MINSFSISLAMDFLIRGRWFFDSERGLLRTCKTPQKADTALRKYWTKEHRQQQDESEASPDTEKRAIEPVTKSKSAGGGKGGRKKQEKQATKAIQKGVKRERKRVVVAVESEDDLSESEGETMEEEELLPSPKRNRRVYADSTSATKNVPAPPVPAMPQAPADIKIPIPVADVSHASAFSLQGNGGIPSVSATATPVANSAGLTSEMLQLVLSTAYDAATLNQRCQDLQRREWDFEQKRQLKEAEDNKRQFLHQAANALKPFYNLSR